MLAGEESSPTLLILRKSMALTQSKSAKRKSDLGG